jgi:RHS repeat-associated protein
MKGDLHVRFCGSLGGKFPGATRQANRLVTALDQCDDPAAEVATPSSEVYVQSLAYNMDDVFNLTSYVVTPYGGSASTTNFTVNAMNEYTAVGGVTHLYHDNGSLKDDGTYTYKYDAHDHLVEVRLKSNGSLVAEHFYDAVGLGRRTKKVVGQDTTRFVYHGLHCVEEYDGQGDLLRLFAFGDEIDQVVMMETPDRADVDDDQDTTELKRFYYHTQLVGSVTHLSDPDENVVESYEYAPYGATAILDQSASTVSASPVGNPFLYTGRRLDDETGLYYYRARHYSPSLKRFVQRDPLEYVDGPNALAYCRSAPVSRHDPLGMEGETPTPSEGRTPYDAYVNALYVAPRDSYGVTRAELVEDKLQRVEEESLGIVHRPGGPPCHSGTARITGHYNYKAVATGTYVFTIRAESDVNQLEPSRGARWNSTQKKVAKEWNRWVRVHERIHRDDIMYYTTDEDGKAREYTIDAQGEATGPDRETALQEARDKRAQDLASKKKALALRVFYATRPVRMRSFPYPRIEADGSLVVEWRSHFQ